MKHLWLISVAVSAVLVELACVPGIFTRGLDVQITYLSQNVGGLLLSWAIITLLLARLFTLPRALDATLPE